MKKPGDIRRDLTQELGEATKRLLDRLPVSLPEQLTVRATAEISSRYRWLRKLRLRAFGVVVAILLAAFAAVSWVSAPVWPVIGVAVTAVAIAVNTIGSRLSQPRCMACGHDLTDEPAGPHGVICPDCGSINANWRGDEVGETEADVRLAADDTESPDDGTLA